VLRVINGQQRSGKSFYCVKHIVHNLVNTDRPIATNLPIKLDEISSYACKLRKKNRKKENQSQEEIAERITLLSQEQVREFWNYSKPNSIIYLDELYEVFSAKDWKSANKELLAYTRQHGHYHDDLFLISHKTTDLNKTIRDGVNEMIVVRNTRHMNLFGDSKFGKMLFPGLKFPFTEFRAYHYEEGYFNKTHDLRVSSMIETLRPNKSIFNCYNSFSQASSLNKSVATGDVESDNVETRNYLKQIFDSIKKGFASWIVLFFVLFAVWRGWKMFQGFFGGDGSSVELSSSVVESEEEAVSSGVSSSSPPAVADVKIMTSRTIITTSGQVFAVGLLYSDFLLININNKGVLTWKKDGKLFLSSVVY